MVEYKAIALKALGKTEYEAMKVKVSERMKNEASNLIPAVTEYVDEALNMRRTLVDAINKLSSAAFEDLLHPVFQEDEMTLIMVGGMLGVAVGMIQAIIQVPDQLGIH